MAHKKNVVIEQIKGMRLSTKTQELQQSFKWALTPEAAKEQNRADKNAKREAQLTKVLQDAVTAATKSGRFEVERLVVSYTSGLTLTNSTQTDANPPKVLRHSKYKGVVYMWLNRDRWLCQCSFVICRNFLGKIVGKRIGAKCIHCK